MKDECRGYCSMFWRGAPRSMLADLCAAMAMLLVPPLAAQRAAIPGAGAAAAGTYYPEAESAAGWRRCRNDEEVRKLAGIDPVLSQDSIVM